MQDVVIVLVEPQNPANVGATARAMKNMGLSQLILVAPPAFDPHRARWMAPGCDDMFAQMRIVPDLSTALEGVHQAVATTARHRRMEQPVIEPRELGDAIAQGEPGRRTAILFGREDHGLSAEDVGRCSAILRIPTPEHASLNLAQAVLLVGHALFEARRAAGERATGRIVGGRSNNPTRALEPHDAPADLAAIEGAVQHLIRLLASTGYPAPAEKVAVTARGALQRGQINARELSALRGMIKNVEVAVRSRSSDDPTG